MSECFYAIKAIIKSWALRLKKKKDWFGTQGDCSFVYWRLVHFNPLVTVLLYFSFFKAGFKANSQIHRWNAYNGAVLPIKGDCTYSACNKRRYIERCIIGYRVAIICVFYICLGFSFKHWPLWTNPSTLVTSTWCAQELCICTNTMLLSVPLFILPFWMSL